LHYAVIVSVRKNIAVAENPANNSPYSAKGNHDLNLQYSAAAEIKESNCDAQATAKAINYNGQEPSQSPKSCSSASLNRRHTRKGLPYSVSINLACDAT
jgi:hypothetical protein